MKYVVLLVLLSLGLAAQEPNKITIPTILTYRQELGLTDKQTDAIKKFVEQFRQEAVAQSGKIKAAQAQLETELANHAELPVVKKRLQAFYDARCELHYADLAMGRKLEGVLSAEQLKQWRALQIKARSQSQPKAP